MPAAHAAILFESLNTRVWILKKIKLAVLITSVFSGSLLLPLLLWKLSVRNMPFVLAKLYFIDNQYFCFS